MKKISKEIIEALRHFEIEIKLAKNVTADSLERKIIPIVLNGDPLIENIKMADIVMKWKEGGCDEQKR